MDLDEIAENTPEDNSQEPEYKLKLSPEEIRRRIDAAEAASKKFQEEWDEAVKVKEHTWYERIY